MAEVIKVRGPNGEEDVLIKNINYGGFPLSAFYLEYLRHAQVIGGTSAIIEAICKTHYSRWGMQVHVEDSVSRDMSMTDMSGFKLQDVPFPAKSMEFYFEDPNLPTCIVVRGTMREMLDECGWPDANIAPGPLKDGVTPADEDSINFYCESKLGIGMAFRARSCNWDEMINASQEQINNIGAAAFTEDEWLQVQKVFTLCIKVLAYASIPHYAPGPITRKQMKRGGKPGIKGRPARKAVRVIYMPAIKRDARPSNESREGKRKFLGRRGHLKRLTSDYYVNKKGETIYVPPVPGPNGEVPQSIKTIAKVRKPRVNSRPIGPNETTHGNSATSTPITA